MAQSALQIEIKDAEEVKELLSSYKELFDAIENFYKNEPSHPACVEEDQPDHVKRWIAAFKNSEKLIYPERDQK